MGLPPILSSAKLKWRGYHLEQHRMPCLEARDVVWLNHMVFVQLRPITLELKNGPRFVPQRIPAGHVTIVPPQGATMGRTNDTLDFIAISIEPTFMATACGELQNSEWRLLHGFADGFVEGTCIALRNEVERGGISGRLYSDSLVTSLAVHLTSKYSTRRQPAVPVASLPRAVRLAQAFISDHLARDLALSEIAAAVNLSPFHFSRVFKQHTGLSPYQYVLRQRIERARQLLMRGHSISDVALDLGFYDQSHFTSHFKRLCGLTPRQFAEQCGRGKVRF